MEKVEIHNRDMSEPAKKKEQQMCGVCFTPVESPVVTPCHHTFCDHCVNRWINEKKSDREIPCPLCRQDIRSLISERKMPAESPPEEKTMQDVLNLIRRRKEALGVPSNTLVTHETLAALVNESANTLATHETLAALVNESSNTPANCDTAPPTARRPLPSKKK